MDTATIPGCITARRLCSALIAVIGTASIGAADFPYRLQRNDIAISLTAATLFGGGMALEFADNPPTEVVHAPLQASTINRFDRPSVNRWSPGADRLSDIALGAILVAPALPGLPLLRKGAWPELATLTTMYGEAVLLTAGVSATVKELTHRNRPYLYNGTITGAEFSRLAADRDCQRSFFSRHTALAFCSAAFLSKTTSDIYGYSKLTAAVWGGSLAVATAIAGARYAAGQHFPTDILTGALVGSFIGYGIPWLHRTDTRQSVDVGFAGDRLVAVWRF